MSADALPPLVRAALAARGSGEPTEAVRTRREVAFPSLSGEPRLAWMWLVRSPGQLWLVAAHEPTPLGLASDVAVGIGNPAEASLHRTLGRDAVVVGGVHAEVSREVAVLVEGLLGRFRSDAGGPSFGYDPRFSEPAPEDEGDRTETAMDETEATSRGLVPGAGPFAKGWVEAAGSDPRDPWLLAAATRTETCLPGYVRDVPRSVAVGGSARRVRVALLGEGPRGHLDLQIPLKLVETWTGSRLEAEGLRLEAPLLEGRDFARLANMSSAPAGARYAVMASARLDEGAWEEALQVLEHAVEGGHEDDLAEPLARVALAAGDTTRAVAHLKRMLEGTAGATRAERPAEDALAEAGEPARPPARGLEGVTFLASAPRRPLSGAPRERAARLLTKTKTPAAAPLLGAPWPPEGPEEVFAAAALSVLGAEAARPPLDRIPDRTRALRWIARVEDTAPAWRAAALACWRDGLANEARDALARSQAEEPRLDDAWLDFQWAAARHAGVELDRKTEVDRALERALALDPDATHAARVLDVDDIEAAARLAEKQGHPSAATLVDLSDRHRPESPIPDRIARARRLRDVGGAPVQAGRMLLRIADAIAAIEARTSRSGRGEPPQPEAPALPEVGTLRLEAASAFAKAGAGDEALEAARAAVREDFLRAEVLFEAASLEGVPVGDEERAWWRHLASVLDPSLLSAHGLPDRAVAGFGPLERLDARALDALHPGGRDWLSELRTRISIPALPPRDQLIRGLERLEGHSFREVFEMVRELCGALGIDPVPTYIYRGDDAVGFSGWPTIPPTLLIGAEHLEPGPRALDAAALRFALAVELAHIAAGHPVLAFDDTLLGTSKSVYQAFGRFAGQAETVVDLLTLIPGIDQLAKLQRLLKMSRRVFVLRSAVDKAHGLARPLLARILPRRSDPQRGIGRARLRGAALQLRVQSDRAALRLVGDVGAATRAILATGSAPSPRLRALESHGLARLLASPGDEGFDALSADEAFRVVALFEDAARSGPPRSQV